jgi:hypothetical protein
LVAKAGLSFYSGGQIDDHAWGWIRMSEERLTKIEARLDEIVELLKKEKPAGEDGRPWAPVPIRRRDRAEAPSEVC